MTNREIWQNRLRLNRDFERRFMKTIFLLLLIFAVLATTACQGGSLGKSAVKEATVQDVKRATEIRNIQFIDVRSKSEYQSGHAAKSVNIPLEELEKESAKLDKDKPVYVICQTGKCSQQGAEILEKAGFKEIYNVQGGTTAWEKAELPIEK